MISPRHEDADPDDLRLARIWDAQSPHALPSPNALGEQAATAFYHEFLELELAMAAAPPNLRRPTLRGLDVEDLVEPLPFRIVANRTLAAGPVLAWSQTAFHFTAECVGGVLVYKPVPTDGAVRGKKTEFPPTRSSVAKTFVRFMKQWESIASGPKLRHYRGREPQYDSVQAFDAISWAPLCLPLDRVDVTALKGESGREHANLLLRVGSSFWEKTAELFDAPYDRGNPPFDYPILNLALNPSSGKVRHGTGTALDGWISHVFPQCLEALRSLMLPHEIPNTHTTLKGIL